MAEITWKSILTKLVGGDHLSAEESEWFVDDLMNGNANPAAVGAVLATQQQLGLTPDEVRGAAKAMVSHAIKLDIDGETTDIVGTGGDGAATVNLSSMGAVVAAASGAKVVKHGNRAASSKCGTADCFEALGLPLDLEPEQVAEVGNECGIAFAFARTFHPAMRFVGPIRAALGVPCVFNVLGPLTNPANPKHMAVGCANRKMSPIMAAVYAANGQIGMVYTSHEGLDEMAPTGPVSIWEFKDGKVVKATSNNTEYMNEILDIDEGARYVGEFAFGVNPVINHPIGDILFDEKIAGSFHFTPGNSYDNASNGNKSAVHWDLIQIQTPEYGGGEIWFDDVLIRKDGLFVLDDLKCLNPENLLSEDE